MKIVERAKYDAWKKLGKMSSNDAKKEFIKLYKSKNPTFEAKL